jgi:heptosyltransferase-2
LAQFNLVKTAGQPILALCPGAAFGETKKWPVEYFAEIANAKLNEGWQVWLFGSAKDQDSTSAIQQQTNHRCVDLSGKLRLDATVDLISQVSLVISNDSGLLHVAAALDIPLVGIYGSTSADFTPPLNEKVRVLGVEGLACRPCFKRTCQYQHLKCLRDLKPEVVMTAIDELM